MHQVDRVYWSKEENGKIILEIPSRIVSKGDLLRFRNKLVRVDTVEHCYGTTILVCTEQKQTTMNKIKKWFKRT